MLMHGEIAIFTIAVLRYGSIFLIATGFHGLEGIWNEVVCFKILSNIHLAVLQKTKKW
jgi:hypothetical protein